MQNVKKILRIFCICPVVLLCAACVSMIEKTGQVIDGSAFAEKKLAVYYAQGVTVTEVRGKDGKQSLVISMDQFPSVKIRAASPDSAGNFYLEYFDYLGGSAHGWNEYRLDIAGSGTFARSGNTARLEIREIEDVEISAGRIRRYDTRITGTEAVTSLRNRQARVNALAAWMRSRDDFPAASSRKQFEKDWKPVLFPETVSKKKRPADWQREGDITVKAEDIRWNSGYTERVFPEELWAIRNSGTMLRDWEEAAAWIYTEYNRPYITELLAVKTTLQKK